MGFVASAGGKLPESVSKSKENIETFALYFRGLPQRCTVIVNPNLHRIIPTRTIDDRYLSDFVKMAHKGLYSFDKTILNSFLDPNYHLVAKPSRPLKISDLPPEVVKILMETRYKGNIGDILDITSLT